MSCLEVYRTFPDEIVNALREVIQEHQAEEQYRNKFFNPIIREDVFELLSLWCNVIYYPFEDEDNDGFHISMPVNEKIEHFVYINTGKKKEKQIFAAAHELGHIWINNVRELLGEDVDPKTEDALMNRFAAELLLPEVPFRSRTFQKLEDFQLGEGTINKEDMFRLIAYLMDVFYVPFDSVVFRLYEMGWIDFDTCKLIIHDQEEEDGNQLLESIFKEAGYSNLMLPPDEKRAMPGFPELLRSAEESGLFSPQKAKNIRELFGWERIDASSETLDIKENGQ